MKEIYNKYHLYLSIFLLITILILFYLYFNKQCDIITTPIVRVENKEEKEVEMYYVDIKGEVINPGVYEVESNSRIIDVIEMSGGLTENSDISLLNLSKKVTDEMNITIYSKDEVKKAKDSLTKEPEVIEIIKEIEKECICPSINDVCINDNMSVVEGNDKAVIEDNVVDNKEIMININTASIEELMTIPKIGESKAKSIIEYRDKSKFNTIDDIKNVSGIGEKLFDSIKENITV